MKSTHIGLVLTLLAVLGLGGCATSDTQAPTQDGGGGADTGAAPEGTTPEGEVMTSSDGAPIEHVIYFAFDSTAVDGKSRQLVEAHGRYLAANPNIRVKLEGHADERGTREYNLALGERRAQSVERLLKVLGVSGNRISSVSFGEEKPVSPEHDDEAWGQNRRVEIVYQ